MDNKKLFWVVIIGVIVYFNIFFNDFAFDDKHFIVNNPDIKHVSIAKLFTQDVRGVYRPVREVFYAISYKLWGLNPLGYHLNSLIIHILASILVYKIAMQIFKKESTALVSALFFAAHPLHTESVAFITASFDIIGIVFVLAAFFLYVTERKFLSNVFFLLAAFTYELTLTLPLLLVLYDFCFKKIKIKKYISYFAILLFYFSIRLFIIKVGMRNTGYPGGSFVTTMLTITKSVVLYIKLLVFPIGLTLGHTFSLATSVFEPKVLISVILILSLLTIAFLTKKEIIKFSILWFFIALIPVLNIIPIQTPFEERYAYLASISFCMLLAWGITQIKKEHIKIIAIVLILLSYTFVTLDRNQDWKNDYTLFKKTVELSPDYAKGHNNLGYELITREEYKEAEKELKIAIQLNPTFSLAYSNLALAYLLQNKNNEAIAQAENAIKQDAENDKSYAIICLAKINLREIKEAEKNCKKALDINKNNEIAKDILEKIGRISI
ncbi:MAG: hypothetical protein Q8O03_06810, partial [Nanoarchaeota archaeon]|nr:hypothetical protein [Nanoarchaeota archaeon]